MTNAPVGERFGRWVVIGVAPERRWVCQCDCGTVAPVFAPNLKRGLSQGCAGCRPLGGNRRHGLSHTQVWRCYVNMITRCYNPTSKSYADYGARGIQVCERWRNRIDEFVEDMGLPLPGMTIDRIDVNGDYSPENCRWATRKQQARNTRRSVFVELDDGRSVTIAQLAEETGINRRTLEQRLRKGDTGPRLIRPPQR